MTGTSSSILAPGAQWLRWDPHIHAPGTRFNDQFKGDWENYLTALETADPPIRVIGVTDYYGFETYKKVRAYKTEGRLAGCDLLFSNVELRFSIGTAKSWINVHLLVSPADPDHVANAARFLERLTFKTSTRTYCCRPSDLIQLGRAFDASKTDDRAALEFGSEQFKVTFDQLRDEYNDDAWAKENIVIAVAGAKGDGTSGFRAAPTRSCASSSSISPTSSSPRRLRSASTGWGENPLVRRSSRLMGGSSPACTDATRTTSARPARPKAIGSAG